MLTTMLGCDGDAQGQTMGFCSEVSDSNNAGPALPTSTSTSNQLWLQVDEFNPGNYWNGQTDRTFQVELIAATMTEVGLCNDSFDNDGDMLTDCNDPDCASDAACQPAVEMISGCDATFCTFTMAAGPNGGDLCSCSFPGPTHPQIDDIMDPSSCSFFGGGRDLTIDFNAMGYTSFSVDTCALAGDSSLLVYDDAPSSGGVEIACSGDASGEPGFCAEVNDNGNSGPPGPAPVPMSQRLFINVDEFSNGSYWNGNTTRQIDIELIP